MEGWTQRLLTTLVLAVITLLVSFFALALGVDWRAVAVMAMALFAAMVTIQLVTEMRRDVRKLKNQALELSGYESEIGRRVDYLASLVERSGGAAPDELAKRVRAVNHQYASLTERLDRLEEDVAELAIAPRRTQPAAGAAPSPSPAPPAGEARSRPSVVPLPRPQNRAAAGGHTETRTQENGIASARDGDRNGHTPDPAAPKSGEIRSAAHAPAAASAAEQGAPDPAIGNLRKAIASDRLAFHLMPVLALPERTPALYEAVMRLKGEDGAWIESEALLAQARPAGLASLVERKTLYTAAQMLRSVRRMGKEMRLLAPLCVSSLLDERGFAELRQFLEAAPDLREALTLEIAQTHFRSLPSEARQRLGTVADAGFTLSLGDMKDARTDPDTLRQIGFTMARARSSFLAGPAGAGDGSDATLAVTLASHRIDLVATQVSDADQLPTLIDRDVTLAQGTALSLPRLVKPDLLRVPATPPAATPPPVRATREAEGVA